jgi:NDP-sugar pyrophosphorylase family protein
VIKQLEKHDTGKLFVAVGYKSLVIKNYLKSQFSHMEYAVVDDGDVDIIERIKSVIKISPQKDLFVLYGDTISDVNIKKLLSFSKSNSKLGTITIWPLSTDFGIVEVNQYGEVISFAEKPRLDKWVNIGYFVLKQKLFDYIYQYDSFASFLTFCAKNSFLSAYRHEGEHFTINTVLELEVVEQNIHKIMKP